MLRMSSFQRKAHKILTKNGWQLRRMTGNGHAIYEKMVNGRLETTTVSSSPRKPDQALKAVAKCSRIGM